ncbi:unnamed protein product [Moneuplotes crassus]|uniref:Uncharacterized protein n=1 Tax=Euplotes crassus TaxID=5936 RepID=A0AAD1UNC2_EUPCR|nr:unnamed protein product [Moneuplotes crassus]
MSKIACSEINLTNEHNMISDPQRYCDPEKKRLDAIFGNIMKEHMAFTKIAQDCEKSKQQRIRTKIKTFNPIQMEKEMIILLPCYLQCTTSRL